MNKKKALFAGSFDPFTKGHLSVVIQALPIFDQIIIAVGKNQNKNCLFSVEERIELINSSILDFVYQVNNSQLSQQQLSTTEQRIVGKLTDPSKIKVIAYDGLTVDVAIKEGVVAIIRGERMIGDHEAEMQLAQINQELLDIRQAGIVQMLIPCTKPELTFVSSSNVKNLCVQGECIAAMKYVMPSVHNKLMEHYLKQRMQKLLGEQFDENKWKELVKSYTTNRYYHNLSHIGYALNVLDMIKEPYFDKIPYEALELAIFYHDYYCSGNSDDEKRSAGKAIQDYGYLTDK